MIYFYTTHTVMLIIKKKQKTFFKGKKSVEMMLEN